MFASLKNKIKEETGSDLSKIASSWRSGALLGRTTNKDESSQATSPSSSGGYGDSNSESISPRLETYLEERTGGRLDHTRLQLEYAAQLEDKLKERDSVWEKRIEELKESLGYMQGEEAAAAHGVARTAAAEAATATRERDAALRQLDELKERVAAALHAQERLDVLTEEVENDRREWGRERAEFKVALGEAESQIRSLSDEVMLVRASLAPGHQYYQFDEDEKEPEALTSEAYERCRRENVVLTRQLQEARMALADVKTSWSGQIASLETQERVAQLECQLEAAAEDREVLRRALQAEKGAAEELRGSLEECRRECGERGAEVATLNTLLNELQHDYVKMERRCEKERREKDDALLRNAHMSQSIELSQCDIREQEDEITETKARIQELEAIIAQHKENQAACMLIKENEIARLNEIEELKSRVHNLSESESRLKNTIEELETHLIDKNKKLKTLDNRIADMKKTLQRELQSGKSDLTSAEDAEISRRYLKHVVMRFLTAKELEARQLTRALATLLRLSTQGEALLQAALPPRNGISGWFGNMSPT